MANFFFPGMGSFRLGARRRGALIGAACCLCVVIYAGSYVWFIGNQISEAIDPASTAELGEGFTSWRFHVWGVAAFALYFYSFVDVLLIHSRRR